MEWPRSVLRMTVSSSLPRTCRGTAGLDLISNGACDRRTANQVVALAGQLLEAQPINQGYSTTTGPNGVGVVEFERSSTQDGAGYAEHMCQHFVRDFKHAEVRAVSGRQQPPAESLSNAVETVTDYCLSELGRPPVGVTQQGVPKDVVLSHRRNKGLLPETERGAGKTYGCLVRCWGDGQFLCQANTAGA